MPILLAFQKSGLWLRTSGYFAQLNPAFRDILVAFGFQQRALSQRDSTPTDVANSISHYSNTSYLKALRSYRRHLLSGMVDNDIAHLFGWLLLVLLESLRGSYAEMMIHITHGARLISKTSEKLRDSDEVQDIALLMQNYCMGAWVYGVSGFFPPISKALKIEIEGGQDTVSRQLRRCQSDLSDIVGDIVSCIVAMNRKPMIRKQRDTAYRTGPVGTSEPTERLYHLQRRLRELEQRLTTCQTSDSLQSAMYHFMTAGSTLSRMFVQARIEMHKTSNDRDSKAYRRPLGHIEQGLLL